MKSLIANRINKSYGSKQVLKDVSLTITSNSRIGVVGPNGIGKSTLLRILPGLEQADSGTIKLSPPSLRIGYFPQNPDIKSDETTVAYLKRRTGIAAAERKMDQLAKTMRDNVNLIQRYNEALEEYLALGGNDFLTRMETVCVDLGIEKKSLSGAASNLSGGNAARVVLAVLLLARFDIFILDEPTNNLDFPGIEKLEKFFNRKEVGIVVVSHDRAFLDRSIKSILEIQAPSHRAVEYSGNWSFYLEMRETARQRQLEEYKGYVEERESLLARQRQRRDWASTGASKARKAKKRRVEPDNALQNRRIERSQRFATGAKVIDRKLDQLERVEKPWEPWRLQMKITPENRTGDVVARLTKATIVNGDFQLGPIDFEIRWQDRVAILGPNGCGKTTLIKALIAEKEINSGERYVGPSVIFGELDQNRALFDTNEQLITIFCRQSDQVEQESRSLLAKFGLSEDDVSRPSNSLSPGERTRTMLAVLVSQGVNCLVLDEPTNHLDLEGIEQLESALNGFEGTMILVHMIVSC